MKDNWQNKISGSKISFSEKDFPYTKDYCLHHINLRLLSNSADILNIIHQILYYFRLPQTEQYQPKINFGLQVIESPSIQPPDFLAHLELVSFDENQRYYSNGKGMLYAISPNKFMVACNLASLDAIGIIGSDYANRYWLIFDQVFYPILAEMLKQLHLFNIHTAAVTQDGIGILFPARARSGKSTITVSMLKTGFGFLSDDICFVLKSSSQLLLLGFPEPIKVWNETVKLFPELSFLPEQQPCTYFKKSFCVEQVFPNATRLQAIPKFLILPQIVSSTCSKLQPISKTETLVELIPQSLMVANKNIVKHHLEILTQLVDECQCFRLLAGQDISNIPQLISNIL